MSPATLHQRSVFESWWPLAVSWLLMGLELPLVSAVMARLPDPVTSLAAYGLIFPLAMLIEAPILMLLTASNALSRDYASYQFVGRVAWAAGLALSGLHALVAFTPLFGPVVVGLLHAPPEIREPARLGLRLFTPWTAAIAYRRCQQGALIRCGRARTIGIGTAVRLGANALVLALGATLTRWPGIVVGSLAVATGVVSEAVYAGIVVRPIVPLLRAAPPVAAPLTLRGFARFYLPLAATTVLTLFAPPLASAGMARMPRALESLATWPVLNGFVFTLRSSAFALNEVVVALIERPGAVAALRRFTRLLALATTGLLLLAAATPLGALWFGRVSALTSPLVALACSALWFALPIPAAGALQAWFQGVLVHQRRTRVITESMVVYLGIVAVLVAVGVAWGRAPGLPVVVAAMSAAPLAQVAWLAVRAAPELRALEHGAADEQNPVHRARPASQ